MRQVTITTEQVQGVLDRLRAGGTMKDEAENLGLTYTALRNVLAQVVGMEVYLAAMAAQRSKRAKLPPSRNFLEEAAAGTETG